MKKQFFFLLTVLTTTILFSCKKETANSNPPPVNQPPAGSKIKTKKNGVNIQTYEYNSDGNLVKMSTAGKAFPDFTFDYNGNTIIMKGYQADGSLSENATMLMNSKGLVTDYTNALSPNQPFKYEYNDSSRMTRITRYINGVIDNSTFYHYKDGNLASDSNFQANGNFSHCREYEYYPNVLSTIEYENFGEKHWGRGNKNALKKVIYKNGSGAITGTQVYLPYELDDKFRIRKTAYQTNGAGNPNVREYTYY